MPFRFFKQISAPAIFSKAVQQYKQKEYAIAKQLLVKAGKWMPALQEDALYHAISILCDYHFSQSGDIHRFRSALTALRESPHHHTADYILVIHDIQQIIDHL